MRGIRSCTHRSLANSNLPPTLTFPNLHFPETNDDQPSEDSEAGSHKATATPSDEPARKWPEGRKSTNMADRPLPVPVENEPYYMNVDRAEAQNLLRGQPDGTFILRPSSQVRIIIMHLK